MTRSDSPRRTPRPRKAAAAALPPLETAGIRFAEAADDEIVMRISGVSFPAFAEIARRPIRAASLGDRLWLAQELSGYVVSWPYDEALTAGTLFVRGGRWLIALRNAWLGAIAQSLELDSRGA